MAMKEEPRGRFSDSAFASRVCSTMPSAEENTWWLESTAMMSAHRVIDQNGP